MQYHKHVSFPQVPTNTCYLPECPLLYYVWVVVLCWRVCVVCLVLSQGKMISSALFLCSLCGVMILYVQLLFLLPFNKFPKSQGKILRPEEEKLEMPTLKQVKIISREKGEEQESVALKKVHKPTAEKQEEIKKVFAQAETEILVTERYEAEMHFEQYERLKRTDAPKPKKDKVLPVPDVKEPETFKPAEEQEQRPDFKRTQKIPKEDTPDEPGLAPKKVKKLPLDEKDQDSVKLKPFKKLEKPEAVPEKNAKKEPGMKEPISFERDRKPIAFEKGELPQKAGFQKEPEPPKKTVEPLKSEEKSPDEMDHKPVSKSKKVEVPKEKKPTEIGLPIGQTPIEIHAQEKEGDIPKKEVEKKPEVPQEEKKEIHKKVTPVKKDTPKQDDEKKPLVTKKGSLPKEPEREEIVPVARVLEAKKTPSPKVTKPEQSEPTPVERKPSAGVTKKPIPVKVTPKDSFESITLKKVPKKVSPPEQKLDKKQDIPLKKELSPEAVKTASPMEEVVPEEEAVDIEEEEKDDTWGMEISSQDSSVSVDYEYLEEDELEAMGVPGDRRGERVTVAPHHVFSPCPRNQSFLFLP